MALAALPSTSGVGSLCLHKRLHHYWTARLARPSYWKPVCLSSPRNTILGHAIGLICGYAAFALAVASSPPFGINPGVHGPRLLAAALSLSATGALMALLRISHPPAGATTLIVSLGIISQPKELVIIEVAVILLTVQAFAINRLAGIPYPVWSKYKSEGIVP
jgi:CBS-domain-containing membrane protein